MKTNALSLTALVFTAQAWLFSLLTLLLSGPIRHWELVALRDVVWGCMALAAAGTLLGAFSCRQPAGKASTLAGGLLLVGLTGYILLQ